MKTHRRFLRLCGALALATGAAVGVGAQLGLTWNATPSYPRGLWRVASASWERGDIVLIETPPAHPAFVDARRRGYLPGGLSRSGCAPLLKRVVAIAGDHVALGECVVVNGRPLPNSEILAVDSAGRVLPRSAPSGCVPPGQVWVVSEHSALSFDSRYFGALPVSAIRGRAELLWMQ
jgi:conjugative transfer signal peptidase TraF